LIRAEGSRNSVKHTDVADQGGGGWQEASPPRVDLLWAQRRERQVCCSRTMPVETARTRRDGNNVKVPSWKA